MNLKSDKLSKFIEIEHTAWSRKGVPGGCNCPPIEQTNNVWFPKTLTFEGFSWSWTTTFMLSRGYSTRMGLAWKESLQLCWSYKGTFICKQTLEKQKMHTYSLDHQGCLNFMVQKWQYINGYSRNQNHYKMGWKIKSIFCLSQNFYQSFYFPHQIYLPLHRTIFSSHYSSYSQTNENLFAVSYFKHSSLPFIDQINTTPAFWLSSL